ncbi:DUF3427 domain-containing protein [Rhizobium herbae]|uniref:DUF3427 domain-containing protein n=1 Tax=Rhizobium herbae TaxID=508661 RepID=UPI003D365278
MLTCHCEFPPDWIRVRPIVNRPAGFVPKPPHIFLLVTLEKEGMMDEHRYTDHFISATEFSWQSQNRTKQQFKHGEMIRDHQALGLHIHLLVRKTKKIGPRPAPFIYCGEVDFARQAKCRLP